MARRKTSGNADGTASVVTDDVEPAPPEIGKNVATLRRRHNLSLEGLAALSGVSKSMLSKIERNQVNPTLGIVWRLANSFQLGVDQLIGLPNRSDTVRLRHANEIPTRSSADGGMIIRILSSGGLPGGIEWFDIIAAPRSRLEVSPHGIGGIKHLTVVEGRVAVEYGGLAIEIASNEALTFPADVPHSFRNDHTKRARALAVVTYLKGGD